MRRAALIALLLLAALPPVVAAKGPHASLSLPPETPRPGEPWAAKLSLLEFGLEEAPRLVVVARRGDERISIGVRRLSFDAPRHPDVLRKARYRLRGVFPSAGEWLLTVSGTGAEPYRFEPLQVGGGAATPVRHYLALPGASPARVTPLPPEVVPPPAAPSGTGDEPARLWIPAAGVALLAGGFVVVRRRRMAAG